MKGRAMEKSDSEVVRLLGGEGAGRSGSEKVRQGDDKIAGQLGSKMVRCETVGGEMVRQ